MNQQGEAPKINQSMDGPPLGHEPPQSRRRNPLTPFGPAGQYRLTNGWPWCSRLATAKGESVYEDFALSATVDFLFALAGYALARLKFRLTTRRELAGVLPNPRRADDRPSGNHPGTVIVRYTTPASPQGRGKAGFNPIHFAESTRHINVTLVALALSAVSTHLATANVQFGEGQPSTGDGRLHELQLQERGFYAAGHMDGNRRASSFAKSCPRHWGSWIPPTGRYRPGCGIPRCRTNRETADSCPTVAARWSPLLQMMIGMVRGRSGTPDS